MPIMIPLFIMMRSAVDYAVFILICRGLAFSNLGIFNLSTPSFSSALTLDCFLIRRAVQVTLLVPELPPSLEIVEVLQIVFCLLENILFCAAIHLVQKTIHHPHPLIFRKRGTMPVEKMPV